MTRHAHTRRIEFVQPSVNFLYIVIVFLLIGIGLDRDWVDSRFATFV